jgi:dipeptidyl aminopeptidase/acylaminoacyl peptidase
MFKPSTFLASLVCGFTLLMSVSHAGAEQPPITVEEFTRSPQIASPQLSRDGKYFAAIAPSDGRMNIVVMDIDGRQPKFLTSFKDLDVTSVTWVGNERLIFSLGRFNTPSGPGRFDGGGLFVVNRDGAEFRKLSPTVRDFRKAGQLVYRGLSLYRTLPDTDEEVIASGNLRDADSTDLYRLNLKSGKAVLLTTSRPSDSFDWLADNKYVPRVVTSRIKDTQTFVVYHRSDGDSPWEEIARYDRTKGSTFRPLAFEQDNKTLQVAFNGGRDTMAIFKYDTQTKKLGDLVAQHPRYDMGADAQGERVPGIRTDWQSGKIVGYRVNAERPETVWVDETYDRIQAGLNKALPDTLNDFSRTPDGKNMIVTALSDRHPARWYLFNEEKRSLEELFSSRPWLTPERLATMRPFLLKTRDGLEIPSYYFLPNSYKQGEKLPTVLHIHGGPAVRADSWGAFSFGVVEAQILASRGYAVVLPNFRITPGLGGKNFYAGFGSVGRQMSEDHEDAVKWAIAQGFADPDRICISGASYGGYAALTALAKTPELFKCAVAGLVVSDMKLQLISTAGDTASSPAAVEFWKALLGVSSVNDPVVRDVSPVTHASRIKQPLLLYAGKEDIRTPIEQTRSIMAALERAGNPPKMTVIKEEEGHGFGKAENRAELYERILEFFDKYIGPARPTNKL